MVGDEVSITLLELSGGQAKLLITAPEGVPVHRLEVYKRIKLGLPSPGDVMRAKRAGNG